MAKKVIQRPELKGIKRIDLSIPACIALSKLKGSSLYGKVK